MVAQSRSSLSAGIIIRKILLESEEVTNITSKIFPVEVANAKAPYIFYRRCAREAIPMKSGSGPDSVQIQVDCCHSDYDGSLELAEAVRAALDGVQGGVDNIYMRSCFFTDSEEEWIGDAYVQHLLFNVKIS